MTTAILSVQTAPADNALDFVPVFEAPANYKDPQKINEYIADKTARFLEKAALSAVTGRVVAVGILWVDGIFAGPDPTARPPASIIMGDEADILRETAEALADADVIAGHGITRFALPFLVRRMIVHKIAPCPEILPAGRYYDRSVIHDSADAWGMGVREDEYISAADLYRLVVSPHLEGGLLTDSASFARLLTERPADAIQYLADGLDDLAAIHTALAPLFG